MKGRGRDWEHCISKAASVIRKTPKILIRLKGIVPFKGVGKKSMGQTLLQWLGHSLLFSRGSVVMLIVFFVSYLLAYHLHQLYLRPVIFVGDPPLGVKQRVFWVSGCLARRSALQLYSVFFVSFSLVYLHQLYLRPFFLSHQQEALA